MESNQNQGRFNWLRLENLPFIASVILFVLIPIFFLPSQFVSFQFAKSFLLTIGTTATFALLLVGVIKRGSFGFAKSPVLLGLLSVIFAFLVSSLFSAPLVKSLIGYGFESLTFGMVFILSILTYVVASSFSDSRRVFIGYVAFLSVSGLLALVHILRALLGPEFLSLGIFTLITSNTIGTWSELHIFFGISIILSVLALELLKLSVLQRVFTWSVLALSVLISFVVGYIMIWYVLVAVLVLFFIYHSASTSLLASKMSVVSPSDENLGNQSETHLETRLEAPRRRIAVKTFFIAIFFALLILPISRDISQNISIKFGIQNVEVRPSWSSNQNILIDTLKDSPILGAGPNNFISQWQLFRPDINISNFWNADFEYGFGIVPTSFVETGVLGILAWLAFFISFLYVGFRSLFVRGVDMSTRYLIVSSFAVTAYLWFVNIIYVTSLPLVALTFFFTGLFIAITTFSGVTRSRQVLFLKHEKASFAVVMVSVFLIIASLGLGYTYFERGRSSFYFQKGIFLITSGQDLIGGENLMVRATELAKNDIYYRTLSELNVLKIRDLMAQVAGAEDATEEQKLQFQTVLSRAIQFSQLAKNFGPTNYKNFLASGRAYETIVPVQIEGAYGSALADYQAAMALSPRHPGIYLDIARLEATNSNFDLAEESIAKSLELKPNFVEAIFLQSQVDVSKGDIPAAIRSVELVAAISGNDPLTYFRLGILKYETKDFNGAISALEKSISLSPAYANARYFLGLSYSEVGRLNDAIEQFEIIKTSNPENREVDNILNNLKSGRKASDSGVVDVVDVDGSTDTSIEVVPDVFETLPVVEDY
jgi:tetratricopeptide (TPR) repeat protein